MKYFKLVLTITVIITVIYLGRGYIFSFIVSKSLDINCSIDSVSINPFSGLISAEKITIKNPPGYHNHNAIKIANVSYHLDFYKLITGEVIISEINLSGVNLFFENRARTSNISEILTNIKNASRSDKESKSAVVIDKLNIVNSQVILTSQLNNSLTFDIPDIHKTDFITKNQNKSITEATFGVISSFATIAVKVASNSNTFEIGGLMNDLYNIGIDLSSFSLNVFNNTAKLL